METWKKIEGTPYSISNTGMVRNDRTGRVWPGNDNGSGYMHFSKYLVHRLVAQYFIPNPNNLPCVNHINENRSDNRVSNLEWCSYKYNNNYGNRNIKLSKSKKGQGAKIGNTNVRGKHWTLIDGKRVYY